MVTNLPTSFDFSRGRQNHLDDHKLLHSLYNAYAVVPSASGNVITDTNAIQAAIDSGLHVLLTKGEYRYSALTFDQPRQIVTCVAGASIRGNASDSTITVSAANVTWHDMYINAGVVTGVALTIQASNFLADNLRMDASAAAVGVEVRGGTNNRISGRISGNSNTRTGVGIEITEDSVTAGLYLSKFHDLTLNHWGTAFKISTPASLDGLILHNVHMDNCKDYGVHFAPPSVGILHNPLIQCCHFEGITTNIYIGEHGNLKGGLIQACRFGRDTETILKCDGSIQNLTVQGCDFIATNLPDAMVYDLNNANSAAIVNLIDANNIWQDIQTLATGTRASALRRYTLESVS